MSHNRPKLSSSQPIAITKPKKPLFLSRSEGDDSVAPPPADIKREIPEGGMFSMTYVPSKGKFFDNMPNLSIATPAKLCDEEKPIHFSDDEIELFDFDGDFNSPALK